MSEQVTVRRATESDGEAISRLFMLHLESLGYAPDPELDADMQDPFGYDLFLVAALADGTIVGMGGVHQREVRRIFVLPSYRGLGIARRITTELVGAARSRGERQIRAVVSRSNAAALALFSALGFVSTGAAPDHPKMQHCDVLCAS